MASQLHENNKLVSMFPPGAGGSGEDYVSLKNLKRLTIIIVADNATTVTGSVVTFKQATTVAGGGEKPLAFPSKWYSNIDTGASDALVEQTATSLTTDDTNAKNLMYVFDFVGIDLDMDNDFDCVRIDLTSATASVLSVVAIGELKYAAKPSATPSVIVD